MTFTIRFIGIIILISSIGIVLAQTDVDSLTLVPDEALRVTLNTQSAVELIYMSNGNEIVTITARNRADEAMDTVLEIVYPDAQRLAYNDDHLNDFPDLAPTDSALMNVFLPIAGAYIIRVNSYGNIAESEVEVLLTQVDIFSETITEDPNIISIEAQLPRWQTYNYAFSAEQGDSITITARDTSNSLDLIISLVSANGVILAENDDHATNDVQLNVFDAQISDFIIPENGVYTLHVSDFLGQSGSFLVEIVR